MIAPIADVRRTAMAWLRERWPAQLATIAEGTDNEVLRVRGAIPADAQTILATTEFLVAVEQLPGRTTRHELIAPLDFHVLALTDAAAGDLAREIDAELMGAPYIRARSGASLQGVISRMSPVAVPWADAAVRRFMSSYSVTARR